MYSVYMGFRRTWCQTGGRSLLPDSGWLSAVSWGLQSASLAGFIMSPTAKLSCWTKSWRPDYVAWFPKTWLHGADASSGSNTSAAPGSVLPLVSLPSSAPTVTSHCCSQSWSRRSVSLLPRPLCHRIWAGAHQVLLQSSACSKRATDRQKIPAPVYRPRQGVVVP